MSSSPRSAADDGVGSTEIRRGVGPTVGVATILIHPPVLRTATMVFVNHPLPIHGRGAAINPPNRFEPIEVERDYDHDPELDPAPQTVFLHDRSKSIISTNDSPDIPYGFTLNPYRGCEHGCIYCYARPTHEYLGLSSGLDFETKIFVKSEAPRLLRETFTSPKWKPEPIALSGVTDCYQPVERRLKITRGCLEVFADFRNPVWITTKNHLVTRDIDILRNLAEHNAACVQLSMTTLDPALTRILEPRSASPQLRLDAIAKLTAADIPVGVIVAPIIPGLNDHEIPQILAAARAAGARFAFREMLRLPYSIKDLFVRWLQDHFPDRAGKVISRIREIRGGKLNSADFGIRMTGEGIFAEQIASLFTTSARKIGIPTRAPELSTAHFRCLGADGQMSLFG